MLKKYSDNLQIITLNKSGITDFAKERNSLLDSAKTDWVFFVDKDEVVSAKLKKEIEVATKNPGYTQAFHVLRKNYFLGEFVGKDKILRIIRKGSGKWVRAVHETFTTTHATGVIREPLVHNTSNNLKEYINKINGYSLIHANENKLENKKSSIFKTIFYPFGKFIQTYIKSGHVVFSIMQSFHSFLSWSNMYLYEKHN